MGRSRRASIAPLPSPDSTSRAAAAWFADGVLNACHNCVDRHLASRGDETAIIWEPDEPEVERRNAAFFAVDVDELPRARPTLAALTSKAAEISMSRAA